MVLRKKNIIVVSSGKGGIGKSFLCANIGMAISQLNKKVTLTDLNLGAPSLHNFMGHTFPDRSIREFVNDKYANLHSMLQKSQFSDTELITCASDTMGITALTYSQRQRLIRGLKALNCDILCMDLPTGSRTEELELFVLATHGVVVLDSMPATLENTFNFLKDMVFRILAGLFKKNKEIQKFLEEAFSLHSKLKLDRVSKVLETLNQLDRKKTEEAESVLSDFRPLFLLNQVRDEEDEEIVEPFRNLIRKYLDLNSEFLGSVAFDDKVLECSAGSVPFLLDKPDCKTSSDIKLIAEKLL